MEYTIRKLKNGTTLIFVPRPKTGLVSCLVGVPIGSNNETLQENGLAHFLEHMFFKGTKKHPTPRDLLEYMENIGAQTNAFTGNEFTAYHLSGLKEDFTKIFELTSEIFLHLVCEPAEIEIERGAILQEIDMYTDSSRHVLDDLRSTNIFKGTPAQQKILGPKKNIRRFNAKDFSTFFNKFYHPANTIIVVVGDVTLAKVEKQAKELFNAPTTKKPTKHVVIKPAKSPITICQPKKVDQAVVDVSFLSVPATHKDSPIYGLVSYVFAKGFSSRLFMRIRQKMGACYYIDANQDSGATIGFFSIETGIAVERLDEVVKAILEECKLLRDEGVSEAELKKVKKFASTKLQSRTQSNDGFLHSYFCQYAITGTVVTPTQKLATMKKITNTDIQRVCKKMFTPENVKISVVGDTTKAKVKTLEKHLKLLK